MNSSVRLLRSCFSGKIYVLYSANRLYLHTSNMNKILIFLLNILLVFNAQSQTKFGQYARMHKYSYNHLEDLNHDYKNLKTIKSYDVNIQYSYDEETGKRLYLVNNKTVDKSVYDKFAKGISLKNCTPCILETYDENDSLIKRAPSFIDTEFDWFIEYYPTGKIKQTGQFAKSEITKDLPWLVYKKDGEWVKYNTNGDTLYSEFWQKGKFVKQAPEQKNTEIWKVNVLYKGNKLDSQLLTITDLNDIVISPEFKNSRRDSIDIAIEVFVGVMQRNGSMLGLTASKIHPDSLKNFDFNKVLSDMHLLSTDQLAGTLTVRKSTEGLINYIPLFLKNEFPPTNDSLNKFLREQKEKISNDENYSFCLINTANQNKKIKVKNNVSYTITYEEVGTDTLVKHNTHHLSGYIKGITDSTIDVTSHYESIYIEYKNGTYSSTEKSHTTQKQLDAGDNKRTLSIQSVKYTNCKSKTKQKCSFAGAYLIAASALTFAAAPLVSIDYIHGGFNSERFRKVALSGGICLSIGIPFAIIGRSKNRKITTKNAAPNSDYWYLEPSVKR